MLASTYQPVLTTSLRRRYLPNMKEGENFIFTSTATDDYNCCSWALGNDEENIILYTAEGAYDTRLSSYVDYYKSIGFRECKDGEFREGYSTIVIFALGDEFTHVARRKDSTTWASKLGEWEDIEHSDLDSLSGDYYGNPVIFLEMKNP